MDIAIEGKENDVVAAQEELNKIVAIASARRLDHKGAVEMASLILSIPAALVATMELGEKLVQWARKWKSRNVAVTVRSRGVPKALSQMAPADVSDTASQSED